MYQTRTNKIANMLTVLGLLLTIVGTVLAWLQLIG